MSTGNWMAWQHGTRIVFQGGGGGAQQSNSKPLPLSDLQAAAAPPVAVAPRERGGTGPEPSSPSRPAHRADSASATDIRGAVRTPPDDIIGTVMSGRLTHLPAPHVRCPCPPGWRRRALAPSFGGRGLGFGGDFFFVVVVFELRLEWGRICGGKGFSFSFAPATNVRIGRFVA